MSIFHDRSDNKQKQHDCIGYHFGHISEKCMTSFLVRSAGWGLIQLEEHVKSFLNCYFYTYTAACVDPKQRIQSQSQQ